MNRPDSRQQDGSIVVTILVVTIFLTTFLFALMVLADSNLARATQRIFLLQTQYAAETGADAAIAILNSGNESYTGTTSDVQVIANDNRYKATYSVTVGAGSNGKEKIITATGKLYTPANKATPSYTRKIEVVAQRSSTATATSMVSRNIIWVDSAVKTITAKDIFVNNFIYTSKNVNNIIAENITAADRFALVGNCSLYGPGLLTKPTSFTTPGQTKTKITTAYNNCITPPGNTSNADFDVAANQNNISKVQSTYIPWTQYMDNTYSNSPTGCNDWTSGGSTRNIPSTGNDKKSHYPDSGSGVSLSCGTLGDLELGSNTYNIRNNVHVRANLCILGCSPTFNNPDATTKYVFVEGAINFSGLTSAPGSGPIVFISYGADPIWWLLNCPLGGAVYLGQSGSSVVNAPNIYLLAVNGGVCLDKTKFSASPALGGVSGKNIWIATNSGTPFDLSFNISFPAYDIPMDLAWKAARYRRVQ